MTTEFVNAPSAVAALLRAAPCSKLHSEEEVGISLNDLSNLMNYVTKSNSHTHPPARVKKVDPICTFSSSHMNVFLRVYLAGQSKLLEGTRASLIGFCRINEPSFVHRCQQLSLRTLLNDLEARALRRDVSRAATSQPVSADDPVVLPQLRANLPWLRDTTEVPRLTLSQTHIRHIVGQGMVSAGSSSSPAAAQQAEKDTFYSSQVKLANEGKNFFEVRIFERISVYDGRVVNHAHFPTHSTHSSETPLSLRGGPGSSWGSSEGARIGSEGEPAAALSAAAPGTDPSQSAAPKRSQPHTDVDFQVILDKTKIRRGEHATVILSLIAKPTALFNDILEIIVLSIDDGVKVVISFAVVNPYLPLFGSPFPNCVAQRIVASPIGEYEAPAMLQLLKHQFVLRHGLACRDLLGLLHAGQPEAEAPAQSLRDVLTHALELRERLDDEADIFSVLAATSEIPKKQLKECSHAMPAATAAEYVDPSVDGASPASSPLLTAVPRDGVPYSPSLPQGFLPGALAPVAKPTAAAALSAHATLFPGCLRDADPRILFTLALLWLAEFPMVVFDEAIMNYDVFVLVASMEPAIQGVVWWVVDFCCALLMHSQRNGTSARALASCFSAVLVRDENLLHRADEQASAWSLSKSVHLRLHVTTALVKLISRYRDRYERQSTTR